MNGSESNPLSRGPLLRAVNSLPYPTRRPDSKLVTRKLIYQLPADHTTRSAGFYAGSKSMVVVPAENQTNRWSFSFQIYFPIRGMNTGFGVKPRRFL